MCTTCGCGNEGATIDHHHASHPYRRLRRAVMPAAHVAAPDAGDRGIRAEGASASGDAAPSRRVRIEQDLLARNDAAAASNRRRLAAAGVFALNLVSSPGSGKTSLLVRTIERLAGRLPVAVIEGDQQTSRDAERIRATGAPATQINTGKGCHLDARMVGEALAGLPLARGGLLLVENVGNLVCPAAFDLGEAHKVVILSVTEGEDKPLKYPDMFRAADLMLLNKCDLLPYLDVDIALAEAHARRVNPALRMIRVSATSGEGMDEWLAWLEAGAQAAADAPGRGVAAPA
ncbi:hydrogenase nickel incorporation protein HypB [Thauera phenolivorans]|uniref:hydrogenase nickel incorporation protein HypB n=1 Tax=Thauera phenolivorans TaxID=1792543 RepID=UPI00083A8E44|nr:hydrogenase nickel incorporation protein HypB [Thauera phenolivorans]